MQRLAALASDIVRATPLAVEGRAGQARYASEGRHALGAPTPPKAVACWPSLQAGPLDALLPGGGAVQSIAMPGLSHALGPLPLLARSARLPEHGSRRVPLRRPSPSCSGTLEKIPGGGVGRVVLSPVSGLLFVHLPQMPDLWRSVRSSERQRRGKSKPVFGEGVEPLGPGERGMAWQARQTASRPSGPGPGAVTHVAR